MSEAARFDTSSMDRCQSEGVSPEREPPSHEPKQVSAADGKKRRFVGTRKAGGKVNEGLRVSCQSCSYTASTHQNQP